MAEKPHKRHPLFARLWHWINAFSFIILLMSGLMILNAHPRLYWGAYGANFDAAWLDLAPFLPDGNFPGWMTIPSTYSLADGRRWHLAFAWIFAFGFLFYMVRGLFGGQVRRAVGLRLRELAPRHIWADMKRHLRLDFHESDGGYNLIQRMTYAVVLCIFIPGMILTGLTMSPGMNAAWPWLLDLFGGRQSARSLHFIFASGLSLFLVVHLVLVLLAGPVRLMRGMITGHMSQPTKETEDAS
jgi:Ni/Fe-hydrogenase b-type cytochrome subunit